MSGHIVQTSDQAATDRYRIVLCPSRVTCNFIPTIATVLQITILSVFSRPKILSAFGELAIALATA